MSLGDLSPENVQQFHSHHLDAFGRLMTSTPIKVFEYSANTAPDYVRYFTKSETGSGTVSHNSTKTHVELDTTTASGDKVILQTRRAMQYHKSNGQQIFFIYKPSALANRRERFGYFDANNGVFFEWDGTAMRCIRRSNTSGSVVDTVVGTQASWDYHRDISDWSKQFVFMIDFGWLSSRGTRFWVDYANGSGLVPVVTDYVSGSLDVPFMATPQLPVRFEVENTGTVASSATSAMSCFAINSFGPAEQEGPVRTVSTMTTAVSVSTTEVIAAGIRLKSTETNANAVPLNFKMMPKSGNDFVYYKIIYNPTVTMGSATWVDLNGVAQGINGTPTSYTGGSILDEGHFQLGNKNQSIALSHGEYNSDVHLGSGLSGTLDPLIITFQTDAGTGSTFFSGAYREFV